MSEKRAAKRQHRWRLFVVTCREVGGFAAWLTGQVAARASAWEATAAEIPAAGLALLESADRDRPACRGMVR